MVRTHPRRFSLMPLIALGILALAAASPVLFDGEIHAAAPDRYSTVIVRDGQTLWSIASQDTQRGANVEDTIDRIAAINHLQEGTLRPGTRIRVPF